MKQTNRTDRPLANPLVQRFHEAFRGVEAGSNSVTSFGAKTDHGRVVVIVADGPIGDRIEAMLAQASQAASSYAEVKG